jgi:hypothetical protein
VQLLYFFQENKSSGCLPTCIDPLSVDSRLTICLGYLTHIYTLISVGPVLSRPRKQVKCKKNPNRVGFLKVPSKNTSKYKVPPESKLPTLSKTCVFHRVDRQLHTYLSLSFPHRTSTTTASRCKLGICFIMY